MSSRRITRRALPLGDASFLKNLETLLKSRVISSSESFCFALPPIVLIPSPSRMGYATDLYMFWIVNEVNNVKLQKSLIFCMFWFFCGKTRTSTVLLLYVLDCVGVNNQNLHQLGWCLY